MDKIYPFFLIVHLFCAIIFVGYLFFDVVILTKIKTKTDSQKTLDAISQKITRFMPFVVLMLFITGGAMAGKYFAQPLESMLQKLLLIKICLAALIFIFVVFSLSCHFIFKCKNPLGKFIHPIVFVLCILIITLAKFMFYL